MNILFIIALVLGLIYPVTRVIILHFPQYVCNRLTDLYEWFFKLKCNEAVHWGCRVYTANSLQAMRSGKTLSMVNAVIRYYKRYNNKKIYVGDIKKVQKIIVISNICIPSIPCLKFMSFEQLNTWFDLKTEMEEKEPNNVYKCLFVLDEIGAVCNSRQYRDNFNIANISSILQMGHLGIQGLVGTSQRFSLCDALLRQVTDLCITSRLIGLLGYRKRVLINCHYIGHDMEEAQNDMVLKPIKMTAHFLYNKNYNCYNTLELATELTHSKDFLSSEEVLQNLNLHQDNLEEHTLKRNYRTKKIIKIKK